MVNAPSFPITVPANGTATFNFVFEYTGFPNRIVTFFLKESGGECMVEIPVEFDWQECVKEECKVELNYIKFLDDMSTPQQGLYFDLNFSLPSGTTQVVACWSEPHQVLYNSHNASYQTDDVLYMIDYARLSQLAAEGQKICFHFILCIEKKHLCHAVFCISAEKLMYYLYDANGTWYGKSKGQSLQEEPKVRLVPNPAEGMVEVVGAERVREITVISMSGERVLEVSNSNAFNAAPLARALYIVRVLAEDGTAHFVKFVRQ